MRASVGLFVTIVALVACGDNNNSGPDAYRPQCSDGVDNDADGMQDFPDDLGCENADDESEDSLPKAQCSDDRDNDGDGRIDHPNDPACTEPQFDSEVDDCPDGPACPQCGDGVDNDANGQSDYPSDQGCTSAGDALEFTDDPNACGAGLTIKPLPANGEDNGMLALPSATMLATTCNGASGAPAIAYVIHLSSPKVMIATTDEAGTMVDTILDVRSVTCADSSASIACHDNVTPTNTRSTLTRALAAGTYYLIVSAKSATATGPYVLRVQFQPGAGTPCTSPQDCGTGLECRVPAGQTQMVCIGPVCDDGIDDDGDGKKDYPNDPGCATPTDASEGDVCPTMPADPACPKCANGLDDDMDGDTDFPADSSCLAASTISESCPQSEPTIVATTPQTTATTVGATNDFRPPPGSYNGHLCSSSTTHTAPDRAIEFDVPAMTSLALRLGPAPGSSTLFDSSHSLFNASCAGMPIDCHDNPNNMVVSNVAAGRYYLVVDGYSTSSGAFTLTISGTIKNGESCEAPLAQSGAIACATGYACLGAVGSRVCAPTECNDGMDNNGDGRMDYPADPGCATPSDVSENTVCPGSGCPACSDGVDNDGDTKIDYPMDTGCLTAASTNEGCAESDPILAITSPQTSGTLVGAVDDHDPKCVASNFPDRVFTLDVPTTLQSLTIDTEGSAVDTVLSFMNNTCAEPSIACDDDGGVGVGDSLITRSFVTAGSYTIAVDSDSATLDTFLINVKGVINPGGSCESALFQAGVLECPINFGCNGPAGSRTCTAAQCLDGVDNNGDGTVDFPNDPGCDSASDNTETDVCPGAACPVCSDETDNDGDGAIDYPADPGCDAASSTAEGCVDTDAIAPITTPLTTGTLVGATHDHQPTCSTIAGPDLVYTLTIPNLETLTIDTEGSVVDTVLTFMDSNCESGSAIACDDEGGVGTGDSKIARSFVSAGTYTIGLDADTTTPNTFNLNVQGVIIPGGSCESPLFGAGVLRCSTGFACDGTPGSRTCVVAQCLDGQDNNNNGKTDFPNDPGCDSFSDDTEATVCPGAACPLCGDGIDNDGDGAIDYPADTACFAASSNNEACAQTEPVGAITTIVTSGDTTGLSNDFAPTCGSSTTHSAPDSALRLELPAMATLTLNLSGFDSAHTLLDSTCAGTAIACSDPPIMARTNVAAGVYYVVIDGWSSGSGPWSLHTSGTIAPGGSCEGDLFKNGAFTCTANHACAGTAGSRTCTPATCSDGMDNDGDSKMDFPADPGCTSGSDDTELDDCSPTVGPTCPVCANGVDDDMDMLTDHPMDLRCSSSSFLAENLCTGEADGDIEGEITSVITFGTLAAPAANNFATQSCDTTTGNDVTYALALPVPVASLTIDTMSSTSTDTVLSLRTASCGMELGCDADSAPASGDSRSILTVTNVAAGTYAVIVDAGGTTTTTNTSFQLNVRGTVANGTACTSPLFATGVLACPTGTTCAAGTCN